MLLCFQRSSLRILHSVWHAGISLVPYLTLSYVLEFIGYLNVCSNPLAYALKYRRVHASARRMLAALQGHRPQQNTSHAVTEGAHSTAVEVMPSVSSKV